MILLYILYFLIPTEQTLYSIDIIKKDGQMMLKYDAYEMSEQ